MRPSKKPKPLAVCSVCQALSNVHENLNHRCDKTVNGRRCYGTYKSGLAYLWDACESCEATGVVGSQKCSACAGYGWRLYG
jgi:DnaJ-class molecular chaperone